MPARKEPWKGQHVLIEAIPQVLDRIPHAYFLFVGASVLGRGRENYEKNLRKKAAELNVESHIQFAGHQSPLEPLIKKSHLIVHCSIEPEPFGLIILEALAMGIPLVASNAGGPVEIAGGPAAILLHEPGNAKELANHIVRILSEPHFASTMIERGKERAAFFSLNNRWPPYRSLFESLLAR
jgi:glycosyltransferase involved in cell wall biosynthesis